MKENIKKYLKILVLTYLLQIFGASVAFTIGLMIQGHMSEIAMLIANITANALVPTSFIGAFVMDIVLSIKWFKNAKWRLISIFLMPSNYTVPVIAWILIQSLRDKFVEL